MHLAVLDGVQAVHVEKLEPIPAAKIEITRAGARLPAQCSGVGKILLAHSEWEYVAARLEDQGMPALAPNRITTLECCPKSSNRCERGYAYDHEEILIGLCCRGAPVYGPGGEVVAAVSFSVPTYRFGPNESNSTAAILDTARRISEDAGIKLEEYPDYEIQVQSM
jgi:DNA-binding IclR family transcriptional regulator